VKDRRAKCTMTQEEFVEICRKVVEADSKNKDAELALQLVSRRA